MVADHQTEYNRIIPVRYLEKTVQDVYAFGPVEGREAIILFNDETVLTEVRPWNTSYERERGAGETDDSHTGTA